MPTAEAHKPGDEGRPPSRAMQIASVRFGTQQKRIIDEEAEIEGVSTSQFVRDAAYGRAVLHRARRLHIDSTMFEGLLRFLEEVGSDTAHEAIERVLAELEKSQR